MKLLPMILEPYHYLLTAKRYDHPPRIKDGGRRAVLIRDIINPHTGELLGGYKKGIEGVVIPIDDNCLQQRFLEHLEWMRTGDGTYTKIERLDRTYDFFRYHTHHKTGKYELSHWHTYISRFDFEYVDIDKPVTKIEEKRIKAKSITNKVIQLNLFEDE